MRRIVWIILIGSLACTILGSSVETLSIPVVLHGPLTGFLDIQAPTVGGPLRREDPQHWVNDAFEVRLTENRPDGQRFINFHITSVSGGPLGIESLSFRALIPAARINGVWTPSGHVADDRLISADPGKEFVTYSAANYGIPYLAAATATGKNLLAMGLLKQDMSVELHAAPAADGLYQFELKATVPPNRTALDHQFFLSNDPTYTWFDIAEKYADWVDAGTHYKQFPISDRAYAPIYDSWYWSKDAVDTTLYVQTGRLASETGIGTFLADSGWDTDTGEYNKWLLGSTGNYMPPPEKFPNLPETFDTLKSVFNLNIHLWLQPFAVGRTSFRYPETQTLHIQRPNSSNSASLAPYDLPVSDGRLEDVNLCPQVSATQSYLRNLFTEMASTYHPDGYWIDFLDGVPAMCVAPHHHDYDTFGAGFHAAMKAIRDAILSNNSSPIVEFRAQYANLNNKSFANVWQPFDSPSDFDRMRLDALRLRPFSKGVVVAADELYWPDTLNDAGVARFAMTDVMTGVPSIGANLLDSRPSAVEIVKNWIKFYKTYQKDLTTGQFRPFGSFRVPDHSIESDNRMFVYFRSQGQVSFTASSRKELFLMNASGVPQMHTSIVVSKAVRYQVQAYDHYLRPLGAATEIASDQQGLVNVSAAVQRGGMLVLTPIEPERLNPDSIQN
jgi:hypothetical protein